MPATPRVGEMDPRLRGDDNRCGMAARTDTMDPQALDRAAFVARFGSIFEHSPWIAEAAFDAGLPADAGTAEGLWRALCRAMRAAPAERQRALVLAHPDLAGRLA